VPRFLFIIINVLVSTTSFFDISVGWIIFCIRAPAFSFCMNCYCAIELIRVGSRRIRRWVFSWLPILCGSYFAEYALGFGSILFSTWWNGGSYG
jgi:hypothetical protein